MSDPTREFPSAILTAARKSLAILAVLSLGACNETSSSPSPLSDEEIIWAKEMAIFEGRSAGDISNYISVASDEYLGWPPVLKTPTTLDTLKASADQAIALKGETSNITRKGFTRNGDTAITYFLNHRTRLGEGMAASDERDVNQYYENIHVWNKEDGEWKLIGGFARTVAAPRD